MKVSNPFFTTKVGNAFDDSLMNQTFPTVKRLIPPPVVNPWLSNLISYWKADDNTLDSSGNGLHLNLVDAFMPPPTSYSAGILGDAFNFDGTTGYALGREAPDDVFNFVDDFSISLWIYLNDVAPAFSNNALFSNFDLGTGYPDWSGWILFADNNAGGVLLRDGINNVIGTFTSITLSIHTPYHIVVTRSGSDVTLYINDLVAAISTYAGPFAASTQPLYVGMGIGGSMAVNGFMDEIALWSRALTPTEVTSLYNGGTGLSLL